MGRQRSCQTLIVPLASRMTLRNGPRNPKHRPNASFGLTFLPCSSNTPAGSLATQDQTCLITPEVDRIAWIDKPSEGFADHGAEKWLQVTDSNVLKGVPRKSQAHRRLVSVAHKGGSDVGDVYFYQDLFHCWRLVFRCV